MIEFSFADAAIFKNSVDALVTLIDEGVFELDSTGMKFRAMDPSLIAMVDFFMPKSAFSSFNVEGEEKFGINLLDLSKVLGRIRTGESLTVKLDKEKSRLYLIFKGKSTRRISLPLLDIEKNVPKVPNIAFDSRIKLLGDVLKEGLKDAALVSANVTLRANQEAFIIEAKGDRGEVNIELKKGEEALAEHQVSGESKAIFPLEYLNDLLKPAPSDELIELNLKTDSPLKLHFNVGDASVDYYLAPRTESE
ncbi:MAG: proliferating cell nuclear antigen (pcna) [archaeon]